jgi:hypothetical protein
MGVAKVFRVAETRLRFSTGCRRVFTGEANGKVVIAGNATAVGLQHRQYAGTVERIAFARPRVRTLIVSALQSAAPQSAG